MTTAYPDDFDDFTNPTSDDTMDGEVGGAEVYHDVQHSDINAAVEALEATVGKTGAFNFEAAGGGGVPITVNSGPRASGLLPLATTDQPVVPASGIIQPRPPLIGRTFPGTSITYTLSGASIFGICAGPDGNLWVCDLNGNLWQVTPTGGTTSFPMPDGSGPYSVCAGPDGNLWIADANLAQVLQVTTAGVATAFTLSDAPAGQICAGPDGNLWIADNAVAQVWKVTPAGDATAIPVEGDGYVAGVSICAGPDGNVWLTAAGAAIFRIAPAGITTAFPVDGALTQGICTGPDGNLWVCDPNLPGVQRVTPTGVTTPFAFAADGVAQICAGSGGDLWVVGGAGELWKVTVLGAATQFAVGTGPQWICSGPDGGLWITDGSVDQIYNEPFTAQTGQLALTAGPLITRVITTTGAYAMTGIESVVLADGAVTLPPPASFVGAQFTVKDNGAGTASVLPNAAETIDGASSVPLSTAYEGAQLTTDGTNWYVISQVAAGIL